MDSSRTSQKQKYGPPSSIKPRSYNVMLELLETQANKKLTNEYNQDVKQWLAVLENESLVNPSMIDLQPEIQWFMRPFLLDFLIELHSSFKLQPSTLFLCFNIIDRYCAKRIVFKRHYQLVGCTSLWIASKYEDKKSRIPTLKELSIMCRNAYDEEMFIQMEMHILSTLEWSLSHPNLEECLQLSIQSMNNLQVTPCKYNNLTPNNSKTSAITAISRFLCELSLYDRFFLTMPTSLVAITANLLACSMLQINTSSNYLEDLIKSYYIRKYDQRKPSTSSINLFATPKSFKKNQEDVIITASDYESNSEYEEFFTDEEDEEEENKQPQVKGSFLSGFDPNTTIDQIKKVCLMFIIQLSKITDVLTKKYESLGVIQVIKNFNNRYSFIISTIIDNSKMIINDEYIHSNKLNHLSDILLQLPQINDIESLIKNNTTTSLPIPLTPPSATSQYSMFLLSNHTLSSVCATPINSTHLKPNPPYNFNHTQSSDAIHGFSPVSKNLHHPINDWSSPISKVSY